MNQSKKSSLFIIILLAISLISPRIPIAKSEPGWLEGWGHRVKITIDHDDIDDNLSSFPVLIYISNSSGINNEDLTFIFDEIGTNYLKIAITASDGITETFVEVEKWDLGNEKAWLWANVTANSATDEDVYLYYGNDHADNVECVGLTESNPAENVWDPNFMLLWHMRDKTTSSIADSTSNDVDGTKGSANNPLVTTSGMVDDAQDFSGDEVTHATFLDVMPDDFTIEVCIKLDSKDATQYPFDKENIFGDDRIKLGIQADNRVIFWGEASAGGAKDVVSTATLTTATWYYLAGVHTHDAALKVYVDLAVDSGDTLGTIRDGTSFDFHIGRAASGDAYPIDGMVDELRVSNIARPASWLKATHETIIDDLLDFGIEEKEEAPIVDDYSTIFLAIGLILMLSIYFLNNGNK